MPRIKHGPMRLQGDLAQKIMHVACLRVWCVAGSTGQVLVLAPARVIWAWHYTQPLIIFDSVSYKSIDLRRPWIGTQSLPHSSFCMMQSN